MMLFNNMLDNTGRVNQSVFQCFIKFFNGIDSQLLWYNFYEPDHSLWKGREFLCLPLLKSGSLLMSQTNWNTKSLPPPHHRPQELLSMDYSMTQHWSHFYLPAKPGIDHLNWILSDYEANNMSNIN